MTQFTDPSPNSTRNSPAQTLLALRIIWAALLLGQLVFLGVLITALWGHQRTHDEHVVKVIFYVSIVMLVTVVPIGWFVRGFIYRAGRTREGITTVPPSAYTTGNIVF